MNIVKQVITSIGKWFVSIIEAILFAKDSEFIATEKFDWIETIESNYLIILEEFTAFYTKNSIPFFDDISSSQKQIVEKNKWKSLILLAFHKTNPFYETTFIKTNSIIQKIPNVTSVMFSVLEKDTHILPHRGIYKGLLRCHLGLIIPENNKDCWLNVNGKIKNWNSGKCFVFDDTFQHEAFNKTNESRVILIIDFLRPTKSRWKFYANKWIIFLLSKSPLVTEITDIYAKK
ncbi:MAG TPA: aspartyl/asparaginyl beta-hydroxylase domain-containing protein [Chitinophagales bacterium]|nr:aspartyl/asparaginyl beta-hydroxylase domain-containing protein [Chitinophagales bacterium]